MPSRRARRATRSRPFGTRGGRDVPQCHLRRNAPDGAARRAPIHRGRRGVGGRAQRTRRRGRPPFGSGGAPAVHRGAPPAGADRTTVVSLKGHRDDPAYADVVYVGRAMHRGGWHLDASSFFARAFVSAISWSCACCCPLPPWPLNAPLKCGLRRRRSHGPHLTSGLWATSHVPTMTLLWGISPYRAGRAGPAADTPYTSSRSTRWSSPGKRVSNSSRRRRLRRLGPWSRCSTRPAARSTAKW